LFKGNAPPIVRGKENRKKKEARAKQAKTRQDKKNKKTNDAGE